jgi:pimeloyl-ACP methyl ester carboxylesterase
MTPEGRRTGTTVRSTAVWGYCFEAIAAKGSMIEDEGGIDYAEMGDGPTVVLVPGSCSTGSAWKPVISAWGPGSRFVTTSLPGYGGTRERRSETDPSMAHVAGAVEAVIRKAGGPVHLVGHSFGGLTALAVTLRARVPLASLSIIEPPAIGILACYDDARELEMFGQMLSDYKRDFANGQRDAVVNMIDFYGGAGTFASWPERARSYAMETTPVNLLDWQTAHGFALTQGELARIDVPVLLLCGGDTPQAMHRIVARLGEAIPQAQTDVLEGAAHFMIATHAAEVTARLRRHVARATGTA